MSSEQPTREPDTETRKPRTPDQNEPTPAQLGDTMTITPGEWTPLDDNGTQLYAYSDGPDAVTHPFTIAIQTAEPSALNRDGLRALDILRDITTTLRAIAAAVGLDVDFIRTPPGREDLPQLVGSTRIRIAKLNAAAHTALNALKQAELHCRFHGDVRDRRTFGGMCDSCERPARNRDALSALLAFYGEPPIPRSYTVDTTRPEDARQGMWPVQGIKGLLVNPDPAIVWSSVTTALAERGEPGPYDHVKIIIRTAGDESADAGTDAEEIPHA